LPTTSGVAGFTNQKAPIEGFSPARELDRGRAEKDFDPKKTEKSLLLLFIP